MAVSFVITNQQMCDLCDYVAEVSGLYSIHAIPAHFREIMEVIPGPLPDGQSWTDQCPYTLVCKDEETAVRFKLTWL